MAGEGIELATAYVSLTTSARGLRKEIDREVGGAVNAVGDKQGRTLGNRLAGGFKTAAKIGFAGAGFMAGAALVKGFGRLKSLDEARGKLTGLGHDAKTVDGIMKDALASVKGTAFGMDEAAGAAAQMVAANIKPGKDLEGVLTLIGDSATIAGSSFGEMSAIFSKAAASNKVQGEILAQLGDRGIPILKFLSEEMGVAQSEVADLAAKGKVDFETFRKAMQKGLGGAAQESGKTFSGALKNAWASVGRIGANFLSGVFPQMRSALGGIPDLLAPIEDKAKGVGEVFGKGLGRAKDAVKGLYDLLAKGDYTASLGKALGIDEDSKIVDVLFEIRGGAMALFAAFKAGGDDVTSSGFAGFMERVGLAARKVFDYVKSDVLPNFKTFGSFVKENIGTLSKLAAMIGGLLVIRKVIVAVKAFSAVLMANPIGLVVAAIVGLVYYLTHLYRTNDKARAVMQAAWAKIKAAIDAVFSWIVKTAWPAIRAALVGLGKAAMWLWKNAIRPAFSAIGAIVKWLWTNVYRPYFGFILGIAKTVFGWIKNTGWPIMRTALSAIGVATRTLWTKWIKPNFDRMKSGVSLMVDAFRKAKDGIGRVWSGIKDGVRRPIDAVMGFLRDRFVKPLNTLLSKIPGVDFRISLGGGARKVGGRSGAQRYASGGVLPGYSPGRDNMHWVGPHGSLSLSGGEAIMRPEWTRAVGSGFVHQMNALARRGGVGAVRNALGFARGGIIDDLKKRGSDAFRIASAPMRSIMSAADVKKRALAMLSGIGSNGFAQAAAGVARKAIDGIVAKVKQLTEASVEGVTGGMGGRSAGGGWQRLWAIVKTAFPGAVLTSSYRPGSITASGNRSYHSMGRAIDVSPSMAIFNYMRKNFGSTLRELIYSPAGGAQIKNGRPYFYQGAVRGMHWDHVHIAAKNGGIVPAVFDNGGTLAPGLNLVHNKLGRPEPLVRPEQVMPSVLRATFIDHDGVLMGTIDGRIDNYQADVRRVARMGA